MRFVLIFPEPWIDWIISSLKRGWAKQRQTTVATTKSDVAACIGGQTEHDSRPYGEWCRNRAACAGKGYCPLDPTCGD